MVTDVIKELEAAKAKVLELESTLAKERRQQLASLPKQFGFENLEDFIRAVREASGSARRGRPAKAAVRGQKRGKRARITPELKEKVKAAVQAGKTGAAIAKEFGISVPSVQNIKKEFGLVRSRK
jgi:hypothetical protein